jgi:hypothetical protein
MGDRDREHLVAWLKRDFPRDVLMPVMPGTKRPAMAHKDNQWSWDRWDRWDGSSRASDVCVLLRDLCVVDIDSAELAEAFEARFPVLKTVPCERTSKGRHYWFVRPQWADAEGFFDGAAQVQRHADFKSVCRNGTSGIVVVAPSEGKAWERRPWSADADLVEVPRDVLAAVASPRSSCSSSCLKLHCLAGEVVIERKRCRWTPRMAYFMPFLSGALVIPDDGIPVPALVQPASLSELFHVLDRGSMSGTHPFGVSYATMRDVRRTADFLGLLEQDVARFLVASIPLVSQIDLHHVSPAWAAWAAWAAAERPQIAVDAALSAALRYSSLRRGDAAVEVDDDTLDTFPDRERKQQQRRRTDECWLFSRRVYESHGLREGDRVLAPDPAAAAEARILQGGAAVVLSVLRRFAGRVALAGGAALWCVAADGANSAKGADSRHDYDLFVVAGSDEDALGIAKEVCVAIRPRRMHRTPRAITLFCEGRKEFVVQVVLRRYARVQDIARSFDVGPCKIAAWYETPFASALTIRAERDFAMCVRHMALWLDLGAWSSSTVARAIKYHHKGFEVFVPFTRREAFRKDGGSNGSSSSSSSSALLHSVADLFAVEREATERRTQRAERLLGVVQPSRAMRAALGYADDKRVTLQQLVDDIIARKARRVRVPVSERCGCLGILAALFRDHYVMRDPLFVRAEDVDKLMPRDAMESAVKRRVLESVLYSRLTIQEVARYSAMCKSASDYSGRRRGLRNIARSLLSFVNSFTAAASANSSSNSIVWTTETRTRMQAVNLPALYDMHALRRVLRDER